MAKEVDAWFAAYDNPMAPVMQAVRAILLDADARMQECIKWKSPTFTYAGNLASFNPRAKAHASLMFHVGAKIPGKFPSLEGGGDTARFMRFADLAEVEAKRAELESIVAAWIAWKGGEKTAKKKPAAKKTAKKTAKKKTAAKHK